MKVYFETFLLNLVVSSNHVMFIKITNNLLTW